MPAEPEAGRPPRAAARSARPEPGTVRAADRPWRAAPAADGPRRLAVFGGVYSNHAALRAAIEDARRRGADDLYALGDYGAFGPHPDRVFPLLVDAGVRAMRGNYDDSIARGLDDCQCGYTDPRDNHFARLSYRYTYRNTSPEWRAWLGRLPDAMRLVVGGTRILFCHGSPRRMNEFLWESATSTQFLAHLAEAHGADVILGTHTGLHWQRALPGGRLYANVGALGRPANDGRTEVWYALVDVAPKGAPAAGTSGAVGPSAAPAPARVTFVPLPYDHEGLAREMEKEDLPAEFVATIRTGWWTTCLEVLPARERAAGRY